jgi:hypothetical protein
VVSDAIAIDVPDGWERQGGDGSPGLAARPAGWRGAVIPQITLVTAVAGGATDLDAYVEEQLAGAAGAVDAFLLFLDRGRRGGDWMEIALVVDALGTDLTIVQRHLLRGDGTASVATGSCATADWPDLAATLLGAVRSLRAEGGAG